MTHTNVPVITEEQSSFISSPSVRTAKEIGKKGLRRKSICNFGIAYYCLGDYKKAIKFHQQSLSIAKKIGEKGLESTAYTNLGIAYHSLGVYKKAIEFHQQSLSIAKEIGTLLCV